MPDYQPSIPPKVRDAVYIGGLVAGALVGLVAAVVAVWAPDYSEQVNATAVAVSTFIALVVGGLGTVYRPGAQNSA
jgi:LytS/YehU family sensor histidine kinase